MTRTLWMTSALLLCGACGDVWLGNRDGGQLPLLDGGVAPSVTNPAFCSTMPSLVSEAQAKLGDCPLAETATLPPLTEDSCRVRLQSCTDMDKQQLDLFLTCLRALPTCSYAQINQFQTRGRTCTALLANVNRLCLDTLSKT